MLGTMLLVFVSPNSFCLHCRCIEIMSACILRWDMCGANKNPYDLRYFYSDEKYIAHYCCGMARQALLLIHRRNNSVVRVS